MTICGEEHGDVVTIVETLVVAKWDPLDERKDGCTLLHQVCYQQTASSLQIVEAVIAVGSDINATDRDGRGTPLHIACEIAPNQEPALTIIRRLLAAGSNPNATNIHGPTPLYLFCYCSEVDGALISGSIEALMTAGVNVNAATTSGSTPIHAVCIETRGKATLHIVKAFIAVGADVNIACKTAMQLYVFCSDYVDETPITAIVTALVGAGADINAAKDDGSTPLHVIVSRVTSAALDVVDMLLQARARWQNTTAHSNSPFVVAGPWVERRNRAETSSGRSEYP